MKNIISSTLLVLAFVFSALACNVSFIGDRETINGSGDVVEENRTVGNVSGVQLAMEGTLHISMGNGESLRIEAEDNLMDYIETDVRAGKLVIETQEGINLQPRRSIDYYLTVEELDTIAVSSSGGIEAGDLQAGSFSVTISSSGDVNISNLDCSSLRVTISSSGNLEVMGGQVQNQNITISSSGEYRAEDLVSVEADVALTSSGTATIRVSDRLNGRLSSSGNVYYFGDPRVDVRTTSSGRVVQKGD